MVSFFNKDFHLHKYCFWLTTHSRTRNLLVENNRKIYQSKRPPSSVIPLLSFEGMLPKVTPRFWIILWSFHTVLLTLLELGFNRTYYWCKFFNVIWVENYLNQSWSSFKSCANLLAGHYLSNSFLRKIWLYVINYI